MFYTCWHKNRDAELCLASSTDPTSSKGWVRHGVTFPGSHKSGALLIRDEGPSFLISGAGVIHISNSSDLLNWKLGPAFITESQ